MTLSFLTILGPLSPHLPALLGKVDQSVDKITSPPSSAVENSNSNQAERVGSGQVGKLSLPRTVLSSIDRLIGAGGVIQSSSDNITVYNPSVTLRLLGGSNPHDRLRGEDTSAPSSQMSWNVEVNASGIWLPLVPTSSSLSVIGTNSSGTFVSRTMSLRVGLFTGQFAIFYHLIPYGPLKWTLEFTRALNLNGPEEVVNSIAETINTGYRVLNPSNQLLYAIESDAVPLIVLIDPMYWEVVNVFPL